LLRAFLCARPTKSKLGSKHKKALLCSRKTFFAVKATRQKSDKLLSRLEKAHGLPLLWLLTHLVVFLVMLPLFRCWQALALLLLLGACQRATYSFQAPGPPAAVARLVSLTAASPQLITKSLAAAPATLVVPAHRASARPPRHPRAATPAQEATATGRPHLFQALSAVRVAHRVVSRQ